MDFFAALSLILVVVACAIIAAREPQWRVLCASIGAAFGVFLIVALAIGIGT